MKDLNYEDSAAFELFLEQSMVGTKITLSPQEPEAERILDRIELFTQVYLSLSEKPSGSALIYRLPKSSSGDWGTSYCLIGDELVVGRKPDPTRNANLLAMPRSDAMSANHFRVVKTGDDYVLCDDLPSGDGKGFGSTNGTLVNTDTSRKSYHVLTQGDIIEAGKMVFYFVRG